MEVKSDLDFGSSTKIVNIPNTQATLIPLADVGGYFYPANVEDALQQVGGTLLSVPNPENNGATTALAKGDLCYYTSEVHVSKYTDLTLDVDCMVVLDDATIGTWPRCTRNGDHQIVWPVASIPAGLTSATIGQKVYWSGSALSLGIPTGKYKWLVGIVSVHNGVNLVLSLIPQRIQLAIETPFQDIGNIYGSTDVEMALREVMIMSLNNESAPMVHSSHTTIVAGDLVVLQADSDGDNSNEAIKYVYNTTNENLEPFVSIQTMAADGFYPISKSGYIKWTSAPPITGTYGIGTKIYWGATGLTTTKPTNLVNTWLVGTMLDTLEMLVHLTRLSGAGVLLDPTDPANIAQNATHRFVTDSQITTWNANSSGNTPATTVQSETTYGISPAVGTAPNFAREDHTHGSPPTPTTANVSSTTDKRYVTDADLTHLSNLSGTNTGDQNGSNISVTSRYIGNSTNLDTVLLNLDDSQAAQSDTGFDSWSGTGNYYSIATNQFTLLRGGIGYIKGKKITFAGNQTTVALTPHSGHWVYITSTGTIGLATARTDALYQDNIILFCIHYDGTDYEVVFETHSIKFDSDVMEFLHESLGTILTSADNSEIIGANLTRVTTGTGTVATDRQIKIVGAARVNDAGVSSPVPDSAGAAVTWKFYYRNASLQWVEDSTSTTFPMKYNNAGTMTALTTSGNGHVGIWTCYVGKADPNTGAIVYLAIADIGSYSNDSSAFTVISGGTNEIISGTLNETIEPAQLGHVIVNNNSSGGYISTVHIEKSTARSSYSSGSQGNVASLIPTNTTNFNGALSATDSSVQQALDTLDDAVELKVNKGVANGYASLGSDGKVPTSQLPAGSTGGAAYGTVILNMGTIGTFTSSGSVNVSVPTISNTSIVTCWLIIEETADHDFDDLINDPIELNCGKIVASTGFTIYGFMENGSAWGNYKIGYSIA